MILTEFQTRVLETPEEMNLALLGGRGGGKTVAAMALVLRHCEQAGDRARPLIIRESIAGLREIEDVLDGLLQTAYPNGVRANRQEHIWRLPNGAMVETGYLDKPDDYNRYQGRSFSYLVIEEAGQFRNLRLIDMLKSNLRVKPARTVVVGNPGGRQHALLHQRYIAKHAPWRPWQDEHGASWLWLPSTLDANPHLPSDYESKLHAASGRDRELYRAWRQGDWSIARGAMFGDVLDPSKQTLLRPIELPDDRCETFVAGDYGSSSPSVFFACARLNAPMPPYPRGSLLLLDECHSADPEDWSVGTQMSPGQLAEMVNAMVDRTGVDSSGVVDDAKGLGPDETLINFFREHELYFTKPAKGRIEGWNALRELAFNSYEKNGKPGLWVSERCEGFWATAPVAPRDPLRPEDLDTKSNDHWLDASRYAATRQSREVRVLSRVL